MWETFEPCKRAITRQSGLLALPEDRERERMTERKNRRQLAKTLVWCNQVVDQLFSPT